MLVCIKGYDTSEKQFLLRSKSAPNSITNANLYKVSGFKSSQRIRMKRCNSKGIKGFCWDHDVKLILDRILDPKSANNVSFPIPYIHRHRPSALSLLSLLITSYLTVVMFFKVFCCNYIILGIFNSQSFITADRRSVSLFNIDTAFQTCLRIGYNLCLFWNFRMFFSKVRLAVFHKINISTNMSNFSPMQCRVFRSIYAD